MYVYIYIYIYIYIHTYYVYLRSPRSWAAAPSWRWACCTRRAARRGTGVCLLFIRCCIIIFELSILCFIIRTSFSISNTISDLSDVAVLRLPLPGEVRLPARGRVLLIRHLRHQLRRGTSRYMNNNNGNTNNNSMNNNNYNNY